MLCLLLLSSALASAGASVAPSNAGPTAVIMTMDARGGVPRDTAAQLTAVLTEQLKDFGAFG
jgi:hypothetical protein